VQGCHLHSWWPCVVFIGVLAGWARRRRFSAPTVQPSACFLRRDCLARPRGFSTYATSSTVHRDEQEGEGLRAAVAAPLRLARLPGHGGLQTRRRGERHHRHAKCRNVPWWLAAGARVVASATCPDRRPRYAGVAPGTRKQEPGRT
jgi:hypothetical protein